MPAFQFRARTAQGETVGGIIQADDLRDARLRIEGRGQTVLSVQAAVLRQPRGERVGLGLPRRRSALALLVLLLLLALGALAWLDPWGWLARWG